MAMATEPDWKAAAAAMDATIPATTPVAHAILDRQPALSAGAQVVDLACGTGQPSLLMARTRPEVNVLGIDGTAAMIERAREKAVEEGLANVRFEVMALESLDLPEEFADAVISQFGLLQHGDQERSAAEMLRILRPGATFSIATWDDMALNTLMSTLYDVLAEFVPAERLPDFSGATALAAPGLREGRLRSAGARVIETALHRYTLTLPSFDAVAKVLTQPATFGRGFATLEPGQRKELGDLLRDRILPFQHDGRYVFPVACRLFWGMR